MASLTARSAMTADVDDADISKAQSAYQWVKERIISGAFTPGFRLVLTSIAQETQMSAVPVREAIRQLEAEGLVTFERNVGARVALRDPIEYRDAMATLGIVEAAATALAAPLMPLTEIAFAERLNSELEQTLSDFDPEKFTRLNREFHRALYRNCPNRHLCDLVDSEWERLGHLRTSTFSFVPGRAKESVAEHALLLRLISDGANPAEIERVARGHRLKTLRRYEEATEQTPITAPAGTGTGR